MSDDYVPFTVEYGTDLRSPQWPAVGDAAALLRHVAEQYRREFAHVGADHSPSLVSALLTDLAVLFHDDLRIHSVLLGACESERRAFAAFSREILAKVGAEGVREFSACPVQPQVRAAWLASVHDAGQTPAVITERSHDGARSRVCVYASERELSVQVDVADVARDVISQKARSVELFGEHWVYEHILIVNTRRLEELRLVSRTAGVELAFDGRPISAERLAASWRGTQPPVPEDSVLDAPLTLRERVARLRRTVPLWFLRVMGYTRRFKGAWVLADRRDQANDNAEVLFDYLREHRRDINAWFVIDRNTSAYAELKRSGARVLPFGSARHFGLMKQTRVFICSQSDDDSMLPFGPRHMTRSWLFVYLKHGVIHTDHYRRFNPKQIDLIVTATRDEHERLSDDGGRYRFTESETALTGMPRHDRLLRAVERASATGGSNRRVLLLAPTWRIYLAQKNYDQSWSVGENFASTRFARSWSALLNDERLRAICEDNDLEPVFLMHPRFQRHSAQFRAPSWVTLATYDDDVSGLIARTALMVTDYSSLAFEAAFVGAPTVYFHFDRDEFFSGGHSSQAGSFDYEHQGFGPVVERLDDVFPVIDEMLDEESDRRNEYQQRVQGLYGSHDDRACERVTAEIERRLRV